MERQLMMPERWNVIVSLACLLARSLAYASAPFQKLDIGSSFKIKSGGRNPRHQTSDAPSFSMVIAPALDSLEITMKINQGNYSCVIEKSLIAREMIELHLYHHRSESQCELCLPLPAIVSDCVLRPTNILLVGTVSLILKHQKNDEGRQSCH